MSFDIPVSGEEHVHPMYRSDYQGDAVEIGYIPAPLDRTLLDEFGEVLSRPALQVDGATPWRMVCSQMVERRVGAALVRLRDGIGIFTERDALRIWTGKNGDEPVADFAVTGVYSLPPEAEVAYLFRQFCRLMGFRSIPIEAKGGGFNAIISAKDTLRWLHRKRFAGDIFERTLDDLRLHPDIQAIRDHLVLDLRNRAKPLTVRETMETLRRENGGAVRLVDGKQLVGIFSERDVLRMIANGGSVDTHIEEVMTIKLICARPSDTVRDGMEIMVANDVRHVPFVSDSGENLGMLVQRDPINLVYEEYSNLIVTLPDNPRACWGLTGGEG